MAKTLKTVALLEQPFIKDGDRSVATVVKEAISALGENIQVRRFERCAPPAAQSPKTPCCGPASCCFSLEAAAPTHGELASLSKQMRRQGSQQGGLVVCAACSGAPDCASMAPCIYLSSQCGHRC